MAVTSRVAQGCASVVRQGAQDRFVEIAGFVQWLIVPVEYRVLALIIPDQPANRCGVVRADATAQCAVIGTVPDFDAQVAERIGVESEGVECKPFGVRYRLFRAIKTVVGSRGSGFEVHFTCLGFHA